MYSLYSFDPQPSVVKRCEKHLAAYHHMIGHISPLNDSMLGKLPPFIPPKVPYGPSKSPSPYALALKKSSPKWVQLGLLHDNNWGRSPPVRWARDSPAPCGFAGPSAWSFLRLEAPKKMEWNQQNIWN